LDFLAIATSIKSYERTKAIIGQFVI
jgi:hypothetical protein